MTWNIVSAEIFLVDLPFRFRFRHAAADRTSNQSVFMRLSSSDGMTGWGETLTRPYLTGETPESVTSALRHWWGDLKSLRFSAENPGNLLRPMWERADGDRLNAAWALADIACHDLWLRHSELRSADVSGAVPVTFPVGIGGGRLLLPRVARLRGFRRIKIKASRDLSALKNVVSSSGSGWDSITIDANGCFESSDIDALTNFLRDTGVAYIEQPFAAGETRAAAALVGRRVASVVADESLCTMTDAKKLISENAADVFNVRLAKSGGITGALAMADLAVKSGKKVQLGALVGETDLLANAARFCLRDIRPDLYEYSFPGILLRRNPVSSDLPLFASSIQPGQFFGRGFGDVNEDTLRKMATTSVRLD